MRILGLDIGSAQVKAVEIDTAFGRYELRDYHEVAIPVGQDPWLVVQTFFSGLSRIIAAQKQTTLLPVKPRERPIILNIH